jgi:site-specific DNA recombinase
VLESTIEQAAITAINDTLSRKDTFLTILQENIHKVLSLENDTKLTYIDNRLGELQAELVKRASTKADYEDVADEIHRLREQKQKVQLEQAGRDEVRKRIADMSAFLAEQSTAMIEYNEPLVRKLIEKITVHEDKFTVEFRSGVTVDVK